MCNSPHSRLLVNWNDFFFVLFCYFWSVNLFNLLLSLGSHWRMQYMEHPLVLKDGLALWCWIHTKLACRSSKVTDQSHGWGYCRNDCLASVSFSWMENIFQLTMEVHAKSFLQETPLYIWPLKSWQLGICHWWYQALHHLCSRSRQFIPSWFLLQAAWSQANTCKLVIPMWHLLLLEESWFTPFGWGYVSCLKGLTILPSFLIHLSVAGLCPYFSWKGFATFVILHSWCGFLKHSF